MTEWRGRVANKVRMTEDKHLLFIEYYFIVSHQQVVLFLIRNGLMQDNITYY